jgi:predicted metal-dependent phosphoesterase TrpH
MRIDLHVHTCASPDSLTTPGRVLSWARRRNIDALAITDHNSITAAREMANSAGAAIIIGEEVLTREGEIIGLFLHEQIPMGASAVDTARYIHEQGGLVYLPHPYDTYRHSAIHPDALPGLLPWVDLVEVFNARVIKPANNRLALRLANTEAKPCGAGSDAHLGCEIGLAFIDLPRFENCSGFANALAQAQVYGRLSSPLVHLGSTLARLSKRKF